MRVHLLRYRSSGSFVRCPRRRVFGTVSSAGGVFVAGGLASSARRARVGVPARRALVQRRQPLVVALRALPQRLVRRPVRHRRRRLVLID
eukprot:30035-Pelagococcus_subviridis.AAC.1